MCWKDFQNTACVFVKGGRIELAKNKLQVDNTTYRLKPTDKKGYYKSHNCVVRLVYDTNKLVKVLIDKNKEQTIYYVKQDS